MKRFKKYIRTEDGRIYNEFGIDERMKKENICNYYWIKVSPHCSILYIKEDFDKLKQSDTIEELIDTYVYVTKDTHQPFLVPTTTMAIKDENNNRNTDAYDIYGSVWTDKGLIYVTKMNEDGKFDVIYDD